MVGKKAKQMVEKLGLLSVDEMDILKAVVMVQQMVDL